MFQYISSNICLIIIGITVSKLSEAGPEGIVVQGGGGVGLLAQEDLQRVAKLLSVLVPALAVRKSDLDLEERI